MEYPINLQRQVVRHSLGLLLINSMLLKKSLNLENVVMAVFGIAMSLLFRRSKINYFVGNAFFIASVYYRLPFIYFFSYGFILSTTYTAILRLCLSDFKRESSAICFKLECVGYFLGIFLEDRITLALGVLQLVNIYFLAEIPVETASSRQRHFLRGVYEKIKKLLGENSYVSLSREYKTIVEMYYRRQTQVEYQVKYMLLSWTNFFLPLLFINIPFFLKAALLIAPLVPNKKYHWCNLGCYLMIMLQFYLLAFIFALFCDWNDYTNSYDRRVLNAMVMCRFLVGIGILFVMTQFLGFRMTILNKY